MAEKKGFWATLFGGNSGGCCNMQIEDNDAPKKGGCCDMKIAESKPPKKKKGDCCDMKIVEDEDPEKDGCC